MNVENDQLEKYINNFNNYPKYEYYEENITLKEQYKIKFRSKNNFV
jgi:hypothetical protein